MSDRKYIMLTVGGILLVLLLGGAALVWPGFREARSMRAAEVDLYSRMANLDEITAEVERLTTEFERAQRHAAGGLKIIPESPDVADLIRRLSLRFDGVSVLDQTFTTGSQQEALLGEQGPQAMPITIDMQARFDSVFAVIRATELMNRLVRIKSVRLICNRGSGMPGSYDEPVLNATVLIEAVFDPRASSVPSEYVTAVPDGGRSQ